MKEGEPRRKCVFVKAIKMMFLFLYKSNDHFYRFLVKPFYILCFKYYSIFIIILSVVVDEKCFFLCTKTETLFFKHLNTSHLNLNLKKHNKQSYTLTCLSIASCTLSCIQTSTSCVSSHLYI